MSDWNKDFHNISILYEDKVVRIKSDRTLIDYLEMSSDRSLLLSQHILKEYEALFQKKLKMCEHSLAIEIIAHVFADTILENISELSDAISHDLLRPVVKVLESIREHTKVIDCGEALVDNNRHVWDVLVPFHGLIYGIAGLTVKEKEDHIKI